MSTKDRNFPLDHYVDDTFDVQFLPTANWAKPVASREERQYGQMRMVIVASGMCWVYSAPADRRLIDEREWQQARFNFFRGGGRFDKAKFQGGN